MGKNKKGSRFVEKSHGEDEFERLQAYAEKKGKQIWEVTMKQIEEDEASEASEAEDEDEPEEESVELDEEFVDEFGIKANIEQVHNHEVITSQDIENKNEIKINSQVIIKSEDNTELNKNNEELTSEKGATTESDVLNEFVKNKIEEISEKFPIVVKLGDITKIVNKSDIVNINEPNDSNGRIVRFGNKRVLYEYPREDKSTLMVDNGKKKKKKSDISEIEKFEKSDKSDKKKRNKKDVEELFNEDDLKRLDEARKRREEFAYLEQLRIEEEDEKKKLILEKQPELDKKEKEKKNYKPKPKKKKGK